MNARFLFVSTVALALVSSFAMAGEVSANHEYDFGAREFGPPSTLTRSDVLAAMAASRKANTLVGPMRNGSYNPAGRESLRLSTVTRNEVKTDVKSAVHDGSLRRSDYDNVPVTVSRRTVRERGQTSPAATTRSAG